MKSREGSEDVAHGGRAAGETPAKSAHTPGPWEVNADSAIPVLVWGREDYGEHLIADAAPNFGTHKRPSESERLANARLIAAAPELLEALEKLIEHGKGEDWNAVIATENARAIVRKARGSAEPEPVAGEAPGGAAEPEGREG